MAQDTKPTGTNEDTKANPSQTPADGGRDSRFHYYSGGEVKELEGTRVSPVLWGFWAVLIVVCIGFYFYSGAMGPSAGGFKPVAGSQAAEARVQNDMDTRSAVYSGQLVSALDLNRIPLPAGQSIDQAITAGASVYQENCNGCHGPNQDGNGVTAASLIPKPRNLRDAPFMQSMSYQRITTSVHKGVPGTAMPRWENVLSENEIKDVIAYALSLSKPTPIKAEDAVIAPPAIEDAVAAQRNGAPSATPAAAPKPIASPAAQSGSSATSVPVKSSAAAPASGTTAPSTPSQKAVGAAQPAAPLPPATGATSLAGKSPAAATH